MEPNLIRCAKLDIQRTLHIWNGRNSEYVAYQAYMMSLFPPSPPLSTLESLTWLDKAIRLQAAHQKHLPLSDFAQFDNLQTIYLTLFGVALGA
jgi:hypothetical protein